MKITKGSEAVITVEISKQELDGFGLTYEQIDYSKSSTRKMIGCVLQHIQTQIDKEYTLKDKTQIEVMPDGSSGCLMILTKLTKGDSIRNTLRLLS